MITNCNIINKGNIFTNAQILDYLELLKDKSYVPKTIIIYETKEELKNNKLLKFDKSCYEEILSGEVESLYIPIVEVVYVFVFSEDDDGDDLQSKQLYSLHALTNALRRKWQEVKHINNKGKISEKDADEFATKFINDNSYDISDIMNWDDEWEIEEYE